MQTEIVELEPHSSDIFVGLVREILKSLPVAVGDLLLGSSVQHVVAQLMLKYLLRLGFVAHLKVCSWQR